MGNPGHGHSKCEGIGDCVVFKDEQSRPETKHRRKRRGLL